jgi:hypothetical protein
MKTKLFSIAMLGLFICSIAHTMQPNAAATKPEPSAAAQEQEEFSVLFDNKPADVQPWHYGKEVARLQDVVAKALAIVKSNAQSDAMYKAAMKIQEERVKKLAADMEPRTKSLAEAQKSTSSFAPTLVMGRKSHLTDGLFTTVAALNDVIALQDSRIQALMKRNEELGAILKS